MRNSNQRHLHPIESFDEIPEFASEAEEAAFWSTHSLGEGLLELMQPVPFDDDELPPPRARRRLTPTRINHHWSIISDRATPPRPTGRRQLVPTRAQSWVLLAERPEVTIEVSNQRIGSAASPRKTVTSRLVATGPAAG